MSAMNKYGVVFDFYKKKQTKSLQALGLQCALFFAASASVANATGQLPVTANPGDQLVSYAFTADYNGGSVGGSFTWDFTQNGWTQSQIFLQAPPFGNPQSAPISISLNSLSASVNSQTISKDLAIDFTTPLTPTSGSTIVPGGSYSWDGSGLAPPQPKSTYTITGGVVNITASSIVAPAPAAVWLFGSALAGVAGLARYRHHRVSTAG